MSSAHHPITEILTEARAYWDHDGVPENVRDNFRKAIACRTVALGAEVYSSGSETRLVFHTCKSRVCTSCGQRATVTWQSDLETILPDVPYVGMTFTIPMEFRHILRRDRRLLHLIPSIGAEALMQWAKARYGIRLIVVVVQQTFGGLLNFVPHLHIMVSAGGLHERRNQWIDRVRFDKGELMRAWRYALIALMDEARKQKMLRQSGPDEQLLSMFAVQYEREWQIFISRLSRKAYWLRHDGRYIRRPPIAQHRLSRIDDHSLNYLAKDTRNKKLVVKRLTNEQLIDIIIEHTPERGRHAMRYFGLLSPRSKARLWTGLFALLNQRERQHPQRISWRALRIRSFGSDPLLDTMGHPMHWVGRLAPSK